LATDQIEAGDFLDLPDDVVVEFVDSFGRNPVLENRPTSDLMHLELIEV